MLGEQRATLISRLALAADNLKAAVKQAKANDDDAEVLVYLDNASQHLDEARKAAAGD